MRPLETYIEELRAIRASGAAVKETAHYAPLNRATYRYAALRISSACLRKTARYPACFETARSRRYKCPRAWLPGPPVLPGNSRATAPAPGCGGRWPNTGSRTGSADRAKGSQAEQVQCLAECLLRVVIALQQVLGGRRAIGFSQVDERPDSPMPDTPKTLNTSTL